MICPFCEIKNEKDRIIKEGKYTFVIFSNPRLVPGHLLIVSKRHVEKISELNSGEKEEIMEFLTEFQEKILAKIAKGCDIRQNYRPFQKQSDLKVHHLHFHLQPREFEDELYDKCQRYETDIFQKTPEDEKEKLMKILQD